MNQTVAIAQPKFPFKAVANVVTAVIAQIIFVVLMLVNMEMLAKRDLSGWSRADLDHAIIAARILNSVVAVLVIWALTYSLDRFSPLSRRLRGVELLRAMYFSAFGIAGVCALDLLDLGKTYMAAAMIAGAMILYFFGASRAETPEGRPRFLFPYGAFHYLIQQVVLFPLGWWIMGRILR